MLFKELRKQVADYGLKMLEDRLTIGTMGYISVRDPETGLICSTPSSIPYPDIRPETVLVSDLEDNIIEGTGKLSSEWCVMKAIYRMREDIHALVHTHSRFATTLASLHMDLPSANFSLARCGTGTVRCTGYHDFYSQDLADDIFEKMTGCKACLMGNHGALAGGSDLKEAYSIAAEIEFSSEIYWRAKCIGQPYILTEEEVEEQKITMQRYVHTNDQ